MGNLLCGGRNGRNTIIGLQLIAHTLEVGWVIRLVKFGMSTLQADGVVGSVSRYDLVPLAGLPMLKISCHVVVTPWLNVKTRRRAYGPTLCPSCSPTASGPAG